MSENPIRINIDAAALQAACSAPEPSNIRERLVRQGNAAAPIIQKAFDAAFGALNRLRR